MSSWRGRAPWCIRVGPLLDRIDPRAESRPGTPPDARWRFRALRFFDNSTTGTKLGFVSRERVLGSFRASQRWVRFALGTPSCKLRVRCVGTGRFRFENRRTRTTPSVEAVIPTEDRGSE